MNTYHEHYDESCKSSKINGEDLVECLKTDTSIGFYHPLLEENTKQGSHKRHKLNIPGILQVDLFVDDHLDSC